MKLTIEASRVLDFDMECRPLSWYGGDWVTKEPTAFAAAYTDAPKDMFTWSLKHSDTDEGFSDQLEQLFGMFVELTCDDVIVTGHWIRGFDLPLMNNTALRSDCTPLDRIMTHDTKSDLVKLGGLSKSQENLGSMLDLEHKKVSMSTGKWESANRLTTDGIAQSMERVTGDVRMHIVMRQELLVRGLLGPPKAWSGAPSSGKGYVG
jgi:hypothetical protein